MPTKKFNVLLITLVFAWGGPALAGFLVSPGLGASIYSFQAKDNEETPNYSAVSPSVSIGYSFGQAFDLAGHIKYSSGAKGSASPEAPETSLIFYGGEMAARAAQVVHLGVRGGTGVYQMINQTAETEVGGKMQGTSGGIFLDAVFANNKRHGFQFGLEFLHYDLTPIDPQPGDETEPRKLDQITLQISYVYNGYDNPLIDNSFFGEYLKSIAVWK